MALSRPFSLFVASAIPTALVLSRSVGSTHVQAAPSAVTLVNRMNSAYRSIRSYSDVATITRKAGKKELTATLGIHMQRPNRFLLELEGEKLNTVVVSDGTWLTALRLDRKTYTKTRAPQLIMGSDVLGAVDFPTPGARLISQLLAATAREGEAGKMLLNAKVTGPEPYKEKPAYTLAFPFGEDQEARVTVSADDYLIRQIVVRRGGEAVWTENHDDIHTDKPVPDAKFSRTLPPGAILVTSLPPLDKVEAAESEGDTAEELAKTPEKLEKVALALYRSSGCVRCHEGGGAPDLSQEGAEPEHTVKWIGDHIRNPQLHSPGSSMPAFGKRLTDKNIDILATYLASRK